MTDAAVTVHSIVVSVPIANTEFAVRVIPAKGVSGSVKAHIRLQMSMLAGLQFIADPAEALLGGAC